MTLAHSLDAVDAIITDAGRLRTGLPELHRRARISSRRDGYPNRASGAQPGTITTPRTQFSTHSYPLTIDGQWWNWACTCGTTGLDQWPSSFAAIGAGEIHHDDEHGPSAVSYSDPTGDSTITPPCPDPVDKRFQRASRLIVQAERLMAAAVAQLVEPNEADGNDPWCEVCARVKHPDGKPYLEPVYSKAKARTDVGGRLSDPRYLCRFDYEHVLSEGKLASLEFTKERLVKGRAPRKSA